MTEPKASGACVCRSTRSPSTNVPFMLPRSTRLYPRSPTWICAWYRETVVRTASLSVVE